MAEKVVSSPLFPEIHSDDEEYLKCGKDAKTRPDWAMTPAVKAALLEQQSCPVDKIFDKIQPVRLEGTCSCRASTNISRHFQEQNVQARP